MELTSVFVYPIEGERGRYEVSLTIACAGENETQALIAVVDTVAPVLEANT